MGLWEMFQPLPVVSVFFHSLLIFCAHTYLSPSSLPWMAHPSTARASNTEGSLSLATVAQSSCFPVLVFRSPRSAGFYMLLHRSVQIEMLRCGLDKLDFPELSFSPMLCSAHPPWPPHPVWVLLSLGGTFLSLDLCSKHFQAEYNLKKILRRRSYWFGAVACI